MGLGVRGLVISIALGAGAALLTLSLRFWLITRVRAGVGAAGASREN